MEYVLVGVFGFVVLGAVFVSGVSAGLLLAARVLTSGAGERLYHQVAAHVAAGIMRERQAAATKAKAN